MQLSHHHFIITLLPPFFITIFLHHYHHYQHQHRHHQPKTSLVLTRNNSSVKLSTLLSVFFTSALVASHSEKQRTRPISLAKRFYSSCIQPVQKIQQLIVSLVQFVLEQLSFSIAFSLALHKSQTCVCLLTLKRTELAVLSTCP